MIDQLNIVFVCKAMMSEAVLTSEKTHCDNAISVALSLTGGCASFSFGLKLANHSRDISVMISGETL
jgi:hypothetical protein